jgi:hypothetical protein
MTEGDERNDAPGESDDSTDVVSFDATAAVEAARAVEDGNVLLCVAYTPRTFEPLYASDAILSLYGSEERMREHFAEIHAYVNLDFAERDLFEGMFVGIDDVEAFVTYMGNFIAVRFLTSADGLFFGLGPRADVTGVIEAVKGAIE